MSKKLNHKEIIGFGKGLKEICQNLAKTGKDSVTTKITVPVEEKRYKITISEVK